MKVSLQAQGVRTHADDTLQGAIGKKLELTNYDSICVSVAYMTVSGVRTLLPNLVEAPPTRSKWLVGLDDFVTQPGAIDVVSRIPGAVVRIASLRKFGLRFHPKVFIFQKTQNPRQTLSIIGSSNLTANALRGNAEANVLIETSEMSGVRAIENLWSELWRMGHEPSPRELNLYKRRYEAAKAQRERHKSTSQLRSKQLILGSDEAEVDPAKAQVCWIECGYITAMGREIELKAEQGLFFGLDPSGEAPRQFDFQVSSGETIRLRMKYQGNHMWRLQLTNGVPEVANGLRPKEKNGSLGRSPYVAVIERMMSSSTYHLRFVDLHSREFKRLVNRSKALGTFGQTSARMYGWC